MRNYHQRPDDHRYSLVERMDIVSQVQSVLEERFGENGEGVIGPSLSVVTFVPPLLKQRGGMSDVARMTVTNKRLQNSYSDLIATSYLRVDPTDNSELWRVSLRVAAFQDVDYGRFADEVRKLIDPLTRQYSKPWPKGETPMVSAIYTGVVPIVYKAQRRSSPVWCKARPGLSSPSHLC